MDKSVYSLELSVVPVHKTTGLFFNANMVIPGREILSEQGFSLSIFHAHLSVAKND